VNDTLLEAAKRIAAAGSDSARLDARLLWEHALSTGTDFQALVARRERSEPIAVLACRRR